MPTHRVACTILLLTAQVHGAVLFVDMLRNFSTCVSFKGGMSAWREFLLDLEGERNRDERHKWLLAGDGPEVRLVRDYHSFYSSVATPGWYHMLSVIQWSDWLVATLIDAYGARCTAAQCKVQHPQSCWSLSSFSTSVILPLATSTSGLRHLIVPLPLNSTKQFRGGNISVPAYLII